MNGRFSPLQEVAAQPQDFEFSITLPQKERDSEKDSTDQTKPCDQQLVPLVCLGQATSKHMLICKVCQDFTQVKSNPTHGPINDQKKQKTLNNNNNTNHNKNQKKSQEKRNRKNKQQERRLRNKEPSHKQAKLIEENQRNQEKVKDVGSKRPASHHSEEEESGQEEEYDESIKFEANQIRNGMESLMQQLIAKFDGKKVESQMLYFDWKTHKLRD